jgi:hypothetical protein
MVSFEKYSNTASEQNNKNIQINTSDQVPLTNNTFLIKYILQLSLSYRMTQASYLN